LAARSWLTCKTHSLEFLELYGRAEVSQEGAALP